MANQIPIQISDIMTRKVAVLHEENNLELAEGAMQSYGFRHLPVVDANGLHGVVTIGDLLAHQVSEHETTIQHLNSYVFDMR